MPFAPHTRVQCAGRILSNDNAQMEIFSFGFQVMDGAGGGGPAISPAQSSGLADAVRAWFADPVMKVSFACHLDVVKVNPVNAQGAQTTNPTIAYSGDTPGGVVNFTPWPLQCSLAVSLRTGQRGGRFRGRFYLPPIATVNLDGTYRIPTAAAQGIATRTAALFQDLRDSDVIPVVASSFGTNTQITQIAVGTAVDTMRTRRNDLNEAYTLADV